MTMNILDELNSIYAMLNADEYPQTHAQIESFMEHSEEFVPYTIATNLREADKPEDLPDYIIDFIIELYESGIAEGDDQSMNDLGAMYYGGDRGCEQSFEKAVYYYKMAADKGNYQAMENLGYCYYYGRVGEPDYEKAYQYFSICALIGGGVALYKIGDMYLNGYYVRKSETNAFRLYMHCLDTMTEETETFVAGPVFLRLGKMLLNGTGTETDYKSALVCYQKAESFLYDMVKNGDYMYKNSLKAAIAGQAKAREKLSADLPEQEWTFD